MLKSISLTAGGGGVSRRKRFGPDVYSWPWINNTALQLALSEAAATGLVLGMGAPGGEENWLRGVRQGPLATGVTGATYARSGTRAGLDPANLFGPNVVRREAGRGVRVFGAGSNLVRASEDFSAANWVPGVGATVTANAAIAPNGTLTADQVTFTSDELSRLNQGPFAVAFAAHTFSLWMRVASGTETVRFGNSSPLADAVLTTTWQRFSTTVTGTPLSFTVRNSAAGGIKSILVWGAQLEQSAFATDYIPNASTVASASAGADDLLVDLVAAGVDVNRPMTLIYRYVNEGNSANNSAEAVLFQDSASSTNRISSRSQPTNIAIYSRSGTTVSPAFAAPTPTVGSTATVAVSVSASQIAIVRTGMASVVSNAVSGSPLSLDRLGIGKTEGNLIYSNESIAVVALIPRALSDAEILALVA